MLLVQDCPLAPADHLYGASQLHLRSGRSLKAPTHCSVMLPLIFVVWVLALLRPAWGGDVQIALETASGEAVVGGGQVCLYDVVQARIQVPVTQAAGGVLFIEGPAGSAQHEPMPLLPNSRMETRGQTLLRCAADIPTPECDVKLTRITSAGHELHVWVSASTQMCVRGN